MKNLMEKSKEKFTNKVKKSIKLISKVLLILPYNKKLNVFEK